MTTPACLSTRMKFSTRLPLLLAALAASTAVAFAAAPVLPGWAFPSQTPGGARGPRGTPDDGSPKRVPGSDVALTRAQITGRGVPVADWHPADHPPMPDIVGKPKTEQNLLSCGYCHLPTGAGRPENSSLAGLTPGYITQQVLAFKNGERPGSDARRGPQTNMIAVAKAVTPEELAQAAAYFASLKPAKFITVVEAETAPKTYVVGNILAKLPDGGTEPVGNRIVEVPDELERFELRDAHTPYTAYVPPGSLKKGAELVAGGGAGKTIVCGICHGADMHGLGDVPRLAGRSPSYLMRQLYDMKNGARTTLNSALMKAVVAGLTEEDMMNIAAYLASLPP